MYKPTIVLKTRLIYKYVFMFMVVLNSYNSIAQNKTLQFLEKIQLAIPEPSGLTYANGKLYAVSDATHRIYEFTVSGAVSNTFLVAAKDLEGITYYPKKNRFYMVSERKRFLVSYEIGEGTLKRHKVKGKQKEGSNNGLEGVCYNTKNNSFYLINEAHPKKLLKVSKKGEVSKMYDLKFAKDVSGICYDEKNNTFWMLSDESQGLYHTDKKGKLLEKFAIDIVAPEGIVLVEGKMYIVSDATSEMFVYQLY